MPFDREAHLDLRCAGGDALSGATTHAARHLHDGNVVEKEGDLFAEAKKCEPSVIFIDEIDGIGSREKKVVAVEHQVKKTEQLISYWQKWMDFSQVKIWLFSLLQIFLKI